MAGDFDNKVILITGASGNVGAAAARRFAAGGARLALVARSTDSLASLAAELGGDPLLLAADLTQADEVDRIVTQAEARYGQIDALIHTVGGFFMGKPVSETAVDELTRAWTLNTLPVFLMTGRVARHMLERGVQGHLVVVVAKSAQAGAAKQAAYTASKAAALRIVESLAAEVRESGIHVNAISPRTIDTPENRADMPKADFSKWVTPEEVADAMAFLASPASAGLYGANLEVFGRAG